MNRMHSLNSKQTFKEPAQNSENKQIRESFMTNLLNQKNHYSNINYKNIKQQVNEDIKDQRQKSQERPNFNLFSMQQNQNEQNPNFNKIQKINSNIFQENQGSPFQTKNANMLLIRSKDNLTQKDIFSSTTILGKHILNTQKQEPKEQKNEHKGQEQKYGAVGQMIANQEIIQENKELKILVQKLEKKSQSRKLCVKKLYKLLELRDSQPQNQTNLIKYYDLNVLQHSKLVETLLNLNNNENLFQYLELSNKQAKMMKIYAKEDKEEYQEILNYILQEKNELIEKFKQNKGDCQISKVKQQQNELKDMQEQYNNLVLKLQEVCKVDQKTGLKELLKHVENLSEKNSNQQCQRFEDEINNLKQQKSQVEIQQNNQQLELKKLKQQKEDIQYFNIELENTNQQLKQQLDKKQTQIDQHISDIKKFKDLYENSKALVQNYQNNQKQYCDEINKLSVEYNNQQNSKQIQQKLIDELIIQKEKFQAELLQRKSADDEMQMKIYQLQEDIHNKQEQIQNDQQNYLEQIKEYKSEIEQLTEKIKQINVQYQEKVEKLNGKLNGLEQSLQNQKNINLRQIKNLQNDINEQKHLYLEQLQQLQCDLQLKGVQISDKNQQIDYLNSQIQDYRDQIIEQQTTISIKQKDLDQNLQDFNKLGQNYIEETDNLNKQLIQQQQLSEDLNKQIQQHKIILKQEENDKQELNKTINDLQNLLEEKHQELLNKQQINEQATKLQNENYEQFQQLTKLREEIINLNDQLQNEQQLVQNQTQQMEQVNQDLKIYEQQIISKNKEHKNNQNLILNLQNQLDNYLMDQKKQLKQIEILEQQVKLLQQNIHTNNNQQEKLKFELQTVKNKNEDYQHQINQFQRNTKEQQQENSLQKNYIKLKQEFENIKAESQQYFEQNQILNTTILSQNKQLINLQQELEQQQSLIQNISQIKEQNVSLNQTMLIKDDQFSQLEQQLAKVTQKYEKTRVQLEDYCDQVKQMNIDFQILSHKEQKQQQIINNYEILVQDCKNELISANEKAKNNQSQVQLCLFLKQILDELLLKKVSLTSHNRQDLNQDDKQRLQEYTNAMAQFQENQQIFQEIKRSPEMSEGFEQDLSILFQDNHAVQRIKDCLREYYQQKNYLENSQQLEIVINKIQQIVNDKIEGDNEFKLTSSINYDF